MSLLPAQARLIIRGLLPHAVPTIGTLAHSSMPHSLPISHIVAVLAVGD